MKEKHPPTQTYHPPTHPPAIETSETSEIVTPSTSERGTRQRGNTVTDEVTELIMIMDSNSRFIDFRRLWTVNKTKTKRCGNLYEVNNFINQNTIYNNLKYIFINVGVNDIDDNSGTAVFNMINELLETLNKNTLTLK